MELGRMIFGTPGREHPVDRALQDDFVAFLDAVGLDGYGHPRWSKTFCDDPADPRKTFDNGTFRVRPYYWGDCQCGYERRSDALAEATPHAPSCFRVGLRAHLAAEGIAVPDGVAAEAARDAYADARGVPRAEARWRCDCDRDERLAAAAAGDDHAPLCGIAAANFEHVPSGLELSTYKYFLRDATANRRIDAAGMAEVLASCLASLGPYHDRGEPPYDVTGEVVALRRIGGGHAIVRVLTGDGERTLFAPALLEGGGAIATGRRVDLRTREGAPNRVVTAARAAA